MFQSDRCILRRVILPLISPFLLCGAGILFVLSITEWHNSSLFSVTVYSMGIFAAYSATNDPASSLILSLPILGITVFSSRGLHHNLKTHFRIFLHSYSCITIHTSSASKACLSRLFSCFTDRRIFRYWHSCLAGNDRTGVPSSHYLFQVETSYTSDWHYRCGRFSASGTHFCNETI